MYDTIDPDAPTSCPECGAVEDGMSCRDRLGLIVAWEAQDRELGAEHFLSVASFNLQHPSAFTDAAREKLRALFIAHLDEGMPIAEVRRQMSAFADGSVRVARDSAFRNVERRTWPMTIANVAIADQPQGAAERVRAWARSVRAEL
jgi:hypothetical protein